MRIIVRRLFFVLVTSGTMLVFAAHADVGTPELGLLLQSVFDHQDDRSTGNNGFDIATARINLKGDLHDDWNYYMQVDLSRSDVLLDARAQWQREKWSITFGQFKAPFSAEALTSAASTDFINRSQVASKLAPSRQVGVSSSGQFQNVGWHFGVFNGNGINNSNDNDRVMAVGRLESALGGGAETTRTRKIGASVAYSDDEGLNFFDNSLTGFVGSRQLAQIDFRQQGDNWLFSVEAGWGKFNASGGETIYPHGYHLTTGYMLNPKTQLLLRKDRFDNEIDAQTTQWLAGINWWLTDLLEWQNNLVYPQGGASDELQLLSNFQVAF
ncbi:MAG: hypothetical protein HKM24_02800 [Gammaproteobacteria bacterium]|nr:hypothetical protein [Gammaproteobacteria bacterium]